ncbi:hypothetical protein BDP55DRAFT_661436 [Colletotrichum godetiae]|uniref:Uncharacterized protein n=1 Tax=Colletotrichum godetiae TaxID=1209918 RepID=A0AAJ0AQ95_9PEZI|nr:uncharacterized protein BDP55DRAFT_661436 [Colletotrichum godetiae]KAK1676547.1 hypothetical protein BDP55DRAFT_661436 [Colletotrichum godetiae]
MKLSRITLKVILNCQSTCFTLWSLPGVLSNAKYATLTGRSPMRFLFTHLFALLQLLLVGFLKQPRRSWLVMLFEQ